MSEKAAELLASVEKTMSRASEWEKKKTSIPGIFLVRLPGPKLRVMLEFNPSDESGNPTKRRGLYFADAETLDAARKAFPDPRLEGLVAAVEALNGRGGAAGRKDDEVFEV